jgi:hypothetical protein
LGCESGIQVSEQLVSRLDYCLWLDCHQTFIRLINMRAIVGALRIPQHNASCAVGTIALGTRGTKERDYGHVQRGRKMHGTSVTTDEE